MDKELIILKTIDQDIALSQAYASYWQAMAITGVAKNRKMFHGLSRLEFSRLEFTDDEKTADAMATALTHLGYVSELINTKKSLLSQEIEDG